MSINTNIGTYLSMTISAEPEAEGEIKERGNHLAVTVSPHTNSNSASTINDVVTTSLSLELSQYPKLRSKITLIHYTVPASVLTSHPDLGDHMLTFTSPNAKKTIRWAGAILDEFGLHSRGKRQDREEKILLEEVNKEHDSNYSELFVLKSKNATFDLETGSGLRKEISKPVFGMTPSVSGSPKTVKSLIINGPEKEAVLKMLSIFQDIEEEIESHMISPLVEIVRSYCDWTDTGLENRQAMDRMRNDREIALAAVNCGGGLALAYASNRLRDDRDFALAAVRR